MLEHALDETAKTITEDNFSENASVVFQFNDNLDRYYVGGPKSQSNPSQVNPSTCLPKDDLNYTVLAIIHTHYSDRAAPFNAMDTKEKEISIEKYVIAYSSPGHTTIFYLPKNEKDYSKYEVYR